MAGITPKELQQVYSNRFRERQEGRDRIWSVLARHFFQRWIAADAVVVDLGAGYGEFLHHIRAGRKLGVDANPQAALKLALSERRKLEREGAELQTQIGAAREELRQLRESRNRPAAAEQ